MALERHGGPYSGSLQLKELGGPLDLWIGRESLQALEGEHQTASKGPRQGCQRIVHGQARSPFHSSLIGNVIDPALDGTQACGAGNITHRDKAQYTANCFGNGRGTMFVPRGACAAIAPTK